jgi:hypothetical protein
MALLPILGQKLNLVAGPASPADTYVNGMRHADLAVRSGLDLPIAGYSQGLPLDADGALCLVDATVTMPADTYFQNGLALCPDGLCASTGLLATWNNGLPMAANGTVCI